MPTIGDSGMSIPSNILRVRHLSHIQSICMTDARTMSADQTSPQLASSWKFPTLEQGSLSTTTDSSILNIKERPVAIQVAGLLFSDLLLPSCPTCTRISYRRLLHHTRPARASPLAASRTWVAFPQFRRRCAPARHT